MNIEEKVAEYYGKTGLIPDVLDRIRKNATDPNCLTLSDLEPYDNMHIGGPQATQALLEAMDLSSGAKVLDVGAGLGGSARFIASKTNAHVTGIDLTSDYAELANLLSAEVGLTESTVFKQGSALDLPFEDEMFDAAYIFHVGMNIKDKDLLFEQVFKVIRPSGVIGVFDIMGEQNNELSFPMPWAENQETSFLCAPDHYKSMLVKAGFEISYEKDMTDFAHKSLEKLISHLDQSPNAHGKSLTIKFMNLFNAIRDGILCPHIFVAIKA